MIRRAVQSVPTGTGRGRDSKVSALREPESPVREPRLRYQTLPYPAPPAVIEPGDWFAHWCGAAAPGGAGPAGTLRQRQPHLRPGRQQQSLAVLKEKSFCAECLSRNSIRRAKPGGGSSATQALQYFINFRVSRHWLVPPCSSKAASAWRARYRRERMVDSVVSSTRAISTVESSLTAESSNTSRSRAGSVSMRPRIWP